MAKKKYEGEFEFNASRSMLFPYFSTASGLAQWFADDVIVNNSNKEFTFIWEGDKILARFYSNRNKYYAKFNVIDSDDDPNYFEFQLDLNEFTGSVYVKITDYSEMEPEEARELWGNLINDLREIVGR